MLGWWTAALIVDIGIEVVYENVYSVEILFVSITQFHNDITRMHYHVSYSTTPELL